MADPSTETPGDFGIGAARRAGYSDREIADHVAAQLGADIGAAREAGYRDADIIDFLAPKPKAAEPAPAPAPESRGTWGGDLKAGFYGTSQRMAATSAVRAGEEIESLKKKIDLFEKGDDPNVPERFRNSRSRLDQVPGLKRQLAEAEKRQAGATAEMAKDAEALKALPVNEPLQRFTEGNLGELLENPGAIARGLIGQSATAMVPLIVGVATGGPVGGAVAGGMVGLATGGGEEAVRVLQKHGVDATDPEAVGKALADPAIKAEIDKGFGTAQAIEGAVGAATGALGGVTVPGKTISGAVVRNVGLQAVGQGSLASAGEAAKQGLVEGEMHPGKIAAAGLGEALFAPVDAAGAAFHARGRKAPQVAAEPVLKAETVDDAIAAAREVVERPAIEETAILADEYGNRIEQDQSAILRLFGGLNGGVVERAPDGAWFYRNDDGKEWQLRPWDGVPREGTIPAALAAAQRAHYEQLGVRVVYFENDKAIPFDGAVDPAQPNTIFLSNDMSRNAAQVGAHEVGHLFESTVLPDGTNLGDVLHQQVAAGMTAEGRAHAERLFGETAPKRDAFPEGAMGDSLHADAVTSHLIRELGADIAGEAPKFQTFLPKVIEAVEARYGMDAARDVMRKLIDGLRQAMNTLRQFFFRADEGTEYGQPPTESQLWVANLAEIHDTLAKMYAERFGTQAEKENATLRTMRDAARRDRAIAALETPAAEIPPPTMPDGFTQPMAAEPPTAMPGPAPGPAYGTALQRVRQYQRWLSELDRERRETADASPRARLLRQTEAAILGKVKGVEDRLTKVAAERLAKVRADLDALVNPDGDSPAMTRVREQLLAEQQRMADAAAVGTPSPGMVRATETPAGATAGPVPATTRGTAVMPEDIGRQIVEARAATAASPTDGQKEAGNYAKGRVTFQGIPFVMENPVGSIRRGVDGDGKPWESKLPADYGYISRTEGADGDHVDVYIGPDHGSSRAWVIDQVDPKTGAFDEHKIVVGVPDWRAARDIYERAFSDGSAAKRLGHATPMSIDELKTWLREGDTAKPVGPLPAQRPVAPAPQVSEFDARVRAERERLWTEEMPGRKRGKRSNERAVDDSARETVMREEAADAIGWYVENGLPQDAVAEVARMYRRQDGQTPREALDAAVDRWTTREEADAALLFGDEDLATYDALKMSGSGDPILAEMFAALEAHYAGGRKELPGDENVPFGAEPAQAPARVGGEGTRAAAQRPQGPEAGAQPGGRRAADRAADELGPTQSPRAASDSSLARTASWVIRHKETGAVVMETFDRAKVEALNTAVYEAAPVERHLAEVNARARDDEPSFSPRQAGLRPKAWVEFGRDVDAVLKGEWQARKPLMLGQTSEALRLSGVPDRWLVMPPDVVGKVVGERATRGGDRHSVDVEDLKRLPDHLARPVAVLKSDTQPNAYVAIIDARDGAGHPVMVAIHAAGREITVNRVVSMYGRARAGWFADQAAKGNLLYVDTEKSRGLPATSLSGRPAEAASGLQLPGGDSLRGTAPPDSERKVFTQADLVKGPAFSPRRTDTEPPGPALLNTREATQDELGARQRQVDKERARLAMQGRKTATKPQESAEDTPLFGGDRQKTLFSPRETAPPFFSALTRAVEGLKMEKAPPGQWEATIRNLPGVKPEERAWVGLDDWLRSQAKPVTKAEVLDYLRANEVQVREVEKGGDAPQFRTPEEAVRHLAEVRNETPERIEELYGYTDPQDYVRLANEEVADSRGAPRFAGYKLPGGENYRELLLTLPAKENVRDIPADWRVERVSDSSYRIMEGDSNVPLGYGSTRGEALQQALAENGIDHPDAREWYKSSHWDETNVLAHIRFDDRTGPKGEKVLHIAEVQSDWHQQGRKQGYDNEAAFQDLVKRRDAEGDTPLREELQRQIDEMGRTGTKGVPNAPFKTTWPELAFKRMLRYAAENGYDRVSWDTGETNADRYDLSNKIERLTYYKIPGTETFSWAARKDGRAIAHGADQTLDQVADRLGKDVAERMEKNVGRNAGEPVGAGALEGLDLKVGGEGMIAFYDRQLPIVANKLGKKFGAKVEETSVAAMPDMGRFKIDDRGGRGRKTWRIIDLDSDSADYVGGGFATREAAVSWLEKTHRADVAAHSIAITPAMRDGVMQGQPLFSPRVAGAESYTEAQRKAAERVRGVERRSLPEMLADWRQDLGRKLVREMFDPYVGLKERDPAGYLAARMANSVTGAVDMFNTWGTLKFDGPVYATDRQTGGPVALIRDLGPDAHRFMDWVAANRAERLKAEDRENLYSVEDIATLKALNQGKLGFDYKLGNGTTTRSREAAYLDALKRLDTANKNAQDLAVAAGLLDRKMVDELWANPFYVPFYREAEEGGSRGFIGASGGGGFAGQTAGKKLKGGTDRLKTDLWQNAFGNWAHLIDASIRNRTANQILETAAGAGIVERVTAQKHEAMSRAEKADTVWTMVDGEKTHWRVDDPFTLKAITALDYVQSTAPLMNIGRAAKRLLQTGVAASPIFQIRNLIRDTENSIAVSPIAKNVFGNLADGARQQDIANGLKNAARAVAGQDIVQARIGKETADAIAGGATMRYAAGVDQSFRHADTYLDSESKIGKFWDYFRRVGQAGTEAMGFGENMNRLALYRQLGEQGAPRELRAYEARDLSDFTLTGASPIVRHLVELVPYMNAWMQGLYKVGRAAADADRSVALAVGGKVTTQIATRLAAVTATMVALNLALDAIYADDEDYQNRSEYDRNANFWFKVGKTEFRIPMGFEVAALSRMSAIWIQTLYDKEMTAARAWKNTLSIVGTQMAFNPIPQAVKPLVDLYGNETRMGTPIESTGMERLRPEFRAGPNTTSVAKGLSEATNKAVRAVAGESARAFSPVQIDYLVGAYAGWLGTSALQIADTAVRTFVPGPERPDRDLVGRLTGGLVTNEPTGQRGGSRYVNMLYQQGDAIKEAYATYRDLQKRGRPEEARDYLEDNRDTILRHRLFERVIRIEGDLNEQIRAIGDSPTLSGEQKRVRIMQLTEMKNRAARSVFAPEARP